MRIVVVCAAAGVALAAALAVPTVPAIAAGHRHYHYHHPNRRAHAVRRHRVAHGAHHWRRRAFGLLGFGGFGSRHSSLVAAARRYIGTNPTGWRHDWCARFLSMILKQTGHKAGGNLALGYLHYGHRVRGPRVGAIAIMRRPGRALGGSAGGHVGVVAGVDSHGNPIIISGNTWGRASDGRHVVLKQTFSSRRVVAYVEPNG